MNLDKNHQHVANPSKKLTRVKGPSSTNILVHDHKIQTKEFFSLWNESSSSLKAILFLSFQTVQKIYKGAALQAFLLFAHKRTMPT